MGFLALTVLLAGRAPIFADTLNVLWYTGGVQDTDLNYTTDIGVLATQAAAHGPAWNVTFWSGGAMPAGTFNVLIDASPEGGWATSPSYTALGAALPGLGLDPTVNRIMLTGQDADWHYTNSPGPALFNNPQGFLIDSVDWAGAGTGMGAVFLDPCGSVFSGGFPASFGSITCGEGSNSVVIPASEAGFPINTGLTSAGISGWNTAAHESYSGFDTSKWAGINQLGSSTTDFVTIVSANAVSGGIGTPTVPEPASIVLLGTAALLMAGGLRRRFRRS